jgi:hypothetical protein
MLPLAILALATAAPNAHESLPPPPCLIVAHDVTVSSEVHHAYTVCGGDPTGCDGLAISWASALFMDFVMATSNNCNCNARPEEALAWYYDVDSDNKTSGPIGCTTGALASVPYWASGAASTAWLCDQGTTSAAASSRFRGESLYDSQMCLAAITFTWGLGNAGAGGYKIWPNEITCFTTSAGVHVQVDFDGEDDAALPGFTNVHFIQEVLKRGGNTVSVNNGVLGVLGTGDAVRLGTLEDDAFEPVPTETGWEIDVDDFKITTSVPSGEGDLEMYVKTRSIGRLDGNMNAEADGNAPIVCYADRAIIHGLLGVTLSDEAYLPEADLNLDGVINSSDMVLFNQIPCSVNWDCSTTSPKLNVADFSAYMNSFAGSDPVADIDGSGSLNVLDYTAFLNAYAVGCP